VIPTASRAGGSSALAAVMRGRAGEIFEAAGACTTLRFHAGAAIALGASGGFSPPARLAVSPVAAFVDAGVGGGGAGASAASGAGSGHGAAAAGAL